MNLNIYMYTIVNSLFFARTLFSLIFANLIPREFNITAKNVHTKNLDTKTSCIANSNLRE